MRFVFSENFYVKYCILANKVCCKLNPVFKELLSAPSKHPDNVQNNFNTLFLTNS